MRLKIFGVAALAAAACLVATDQAHAQRGMGMMSGGGPMAGFRALTTPEGAAELKLTENQQAKLREVGDSMRTAMGDRFQSLRDELEGASPEERQEKMQAAMKEVSDGTMKEVKVILNEEQLARYQQINYQAMGVDAFTQKEVAEKLKITDEQKTKIDALTAGMRQELGGLRGQFQDDFQGAMRKTQEVRKSTQEKVTALLTDDQKATWKELVGKPFTMPPFQPRPRQN
jgi:Spy/CpxP family protein refolding chaperone